MNFSIGDDLQAIITPEPPAYCQNHLGPNDTLPLAKLDWEKVSIPTTIGLWIFLSSVARIGFSVSPLKKYIPESCVLICIGFVVGMIVLFIPGNSDVKLESDLFFLFLLPPIMLEAGYFMPMKPFVNNLATILLFAVVGTLFNAATIGLSLWGISEAGWLGFNEERGEPERISLLECFTFSSLISAVDPVAVIAVFEEIHVNQVLFILVFGESLLNDAVTVVLYRMFESFNEIGEENLVAWDIYAGFLSFFIIGLGGVLVGAMFGFLAAFTSRFTNHIRVIEPVFVFIISYLAYLTAEMLSLSSIMSIVTCAMVMKPYVEENFSSRSLTTTQSMIKMLSSISETIIFIFLGVSTLTERYNHTWNTVFVLYTLIFIFIYRLIGVVWQCVLVNRFRIKKISTKDIFIMSYGGIRGAIAFSLSALLCANIVGANKIFFTSTIVVVMFTMFVQGITIKPIVNMLAVKKHEHREPTMNEEIFSRVNDHALAGMETILGQEGKNHLRQRWIHFNNNYLKQILIRDYRKVRHQQILDVYQRLTEKAATDYIAEHGTFHSTGHVNAMKHVAGDPGIYRDSVTSVSSVSVNNSDVDEEVLTGDAPDFQIRPGHGRASQETKRQRKILSKAMFRPSVIEQPRRKKESLMYRSMQIQLQHNQHRQRRTGAAVPTTRHADGHGHHHHHHHNHHHHQKPEQEKEVPQMQPPWAQDKPEEKTSALPPWLHQEVTAPKVTTLPPWLQHEENKDDSDGSDSDTECGPSSPKECVQETTLPWRRTSRWEGTASKRAAEDPHDDSASPPTTTATTVNECRGPREDEARDRLEDIPEHEETDDKTRLLPGGRK